MDRETLHPVTVSLDGVMSVAVAVAVTVVIADVVQVPVLVLVLELVDRHPMAIIVTDHWSWRQKKTQRGQKG